jgi:uncharacterized membrane protein
MLAPPDILDRFIIGLIPAKINILKMLAPGFSVSPGLIDFGKYGKIDDKMVSKGV